MKKRKKVGRTIYALTVLILGILIIIMVVLLLFHVQTIEVSGNTYVSSSAIGESIQKNSKTKNSLSFLSKNLLGKIDYPKAIESAKISLKTPWSIKVTVKEKKIMGYTITNGTYVYFDENGMVLYKSAMQLEKIPYIEGLSTRAELYKKLPVQEKRIFSNIDTMLKELDKWRIKPEQIVSDGADLTIHVRKIVIMLGSGNMKEKISQLPPILKKLEGKEGTLDLRHYGETTETITFKEGEVLKKEKEAIDKK
ncbi:cell division protein FtsQ/DivIB [Faecalimonas sp.]